MCGILGIVNEDITDERLRRSIAALAHRGPDGQGVYHDPALRVGLAHARLAVIDLVSGHQPLLDAEGELVLVANGEIYDFERIRAELEQRGHRFSTRSDSEVILPLYREYGLDLFRHLRGEFAFLLLDRRQGLLIAARDRFGIKPLFYSRRGDGVVLASEAKGIFATGLRSANLDPVKLRDALSFLPVPIPFVDVEPVPPGHFAVIGLGGGFELRKYWDVELGAGIDDQMSLEDAKQIVRREFDEAVRLRLRADVPVGVYLSGGIDSAAVAAAAAPLAPGRLKVFTIEMADSPSFDERPAAERLAAHLGVEQFTVRCDAQSLCDHLEACIWHAEQPVANLHGVAKFLLSRLTREHVKVVLTGEGADEVFLGYDYFRGEQYGITAQLTRARERYGRLESPVASLLREQFGFVPSVELIQNLSPRRQRFFRKLFHARHRAALDELAPLARLRDYIDPRATSGLPLAVQRQHFAIKGPLAGYILSYLGDRQEMAHSVEGRTPFLDHRLFEASRAIPLRYKLFEGREKYVLREAMADRLPRETCQSKKQAFSVPQVPLSSPALRPLVDRYLSRTAIDRAELFDYSAVRGAQRLHRLCWGIPSLRRGLASLLMFVLTAQILQGQFEAEPAWSP